MSVNNVPKPRGCRKIFVGILCGFLYICVILTLGFAALRHVDYFDINEDKTADVTIIQEERVPSVKELINATMSLVDDLKAILNDIKGGNLDNVKMKTDAIVQNIHVIQASVGKASELLGNGLPSVQKQLLNIQNVLSLGEIGVSTLLEPTVDQLQAYPLSGFRADGGISTEYLGYYIDFLDSVMPDVEKCIEQANEIDFSVIDQNGKITLCVEAANRFLEIYREDKEILSTIKAMVGAEEDRLYLLAVQNSTEIRASGGFPGSIGTIRIENGVLKLGDFKSVYNVLASSIQGKTEISAVEYRLFGQLSGISAPRDAVNCPDFERVAYIMALGYECAQEKIVDGVITMTPCIVQRFLAAIDEEILLSDGLVLNGDNATKVLQYDLYFKYFGRNSLPNAGKIADDLFADAAKQTMQKLMGNLSLADILKYLSVTKESFSDRTLMVWMKNETELDLLRRLDWNGGLNTDPQKPQAGVYFNCTLASKMGWFLVLDPQIEGCTVNDDGSCTYSVAVSLTNAITEEEIKVASPSYILGGKGGALSGSAYFFGPAGGTITDFKMSNGGVVREAEYHDLALGFVPRVTIPPQSTVKVTYKITTPPGVDAPLEFSLTPTVQDYHDNK